MNTDAKIFVADGTPRKLPSLDRLQAVGWHARVGSRGGIQAANEGARENWA